MRPLDLHDNNDFQISALHCPIHYALQWNCYVLDIVLHWNFCLSEVIVSDVLDSDPLSVLFHNLNHVRARDILPPVEIHTDWMRFRNIASGLISPRIQINTVDKAERTASNFAASIASACGLSTHKITFSEMNELPEIDGLLQLERRLRNCYMKPEAEHLKRQFRITKIILRMTRRNALEGWGTKINSCEVTPREIWPIANSLMNMNGPKAPTSVHRFAASNFYYVKSQRLLFGKLFQTTRPVGRTPWKAVRVLHPTSTWSREQHSHRNSH